MQYQGMLVSGWNFRTAVEKAEEAAKEKEIFVVSIPEVENDEPKEGEDFKFVAKFDVKPENEGKKITWHSPCDLVRHQDVCACAHHQIRHAL